MTNKQAFNMSSTSKILGNIPNNPKVPSEPHESDGGDDTENRPTNNFSTSQKKLNPDELLEQVQNILKEDLKNILG